MKNYDFSHDMVVIRELLNLTQEKLSLLTNKSISGTKEIINPFLFSFLDPQQK